MLLALYSMLLKKYTLLKNLLGLHRTEEPDFTIRKNKLMQCRGQSMHKLPLYWVSAPLLREWFFGFFSFIKYSL